jgi:hypothetical protein
VWDGWDIPEKPMRLGRNSIGFDVFDVEDAEYGRATKDPYLGYGDFILVTDYDKKSVPGYVKEGMCVNVIGKVDGVNDRGDGRATVVFWMGSGAPDYLPAVSWDSIKHLCPKPAKAKKGPGISVDRTSHNYEFIRFERGGRSTWKPSTFSRREYLSTYITDVELDESSRLIVVPASGDLDPEWHSKWGPMARAVSEKYNVRFVNVYARSVKEFVEGYGDYIWTVNDLVTARDEILSSFTAENVQGYFDYDFCDDGWKRLAKYADEILDPEVQGTLQLVLEAQKNWEKVRGLGQATISVLATKHNTETHNYRWDFPGTVELERQYPIIDDYNYRTNTPGVVEMVNALYTYRKDTNND